MTSLARGWSSPVHHILGLALGLFLTNLSPPLLPAGETTVQLTFTGTEKRDLRFASQDELVFTDLTDPRHLRLMKLTLSTGKIERLHPDSDKTEYAAAFSPDGRHYAWLQNVGNLNLRLVIRNRETGVEADFQQGGFSGMWDPCFTPDGQRLLYAYPEDGRQHIFSCNLQCADRQRLVDSSGVNNWPNVTPDGRTLVFGSTRDGNFELYRSDLRGEHVRRLTDEPALDIRPAVSPHGTTLAFTSNRDGNYELYTLQLDGTGLRRLTTHPERDDFPAWAPDGRLAWVAERDGGFDIWMTSLPE